MAWRVIGNTGEYEDQKEWTVCVYFKKEAAQEHANYANAWLKAHNIHFDDNPSYEQMDKMSFHENTPWDNGFCCDYNGVGYSIEELEIRHKVRPMTDDWAD